MSRHFAKFNIGYVSPVEVMEAEEEEAHDQASMEANQKVAIESSDFLGHLGETRDPSALGDRRAKP